MDSHVINYIKSHFGYRPGAKVKLKNLYKHFLTKNQNWIIPYKIFRENCSLVLSELQTGTKKIEIIKQNNTYFVLNLDFIEKIKTEKSNMLMLAKTFYGLPDEMNI